MEDPVEKTLLAVGILLAVVPAGMLALPTIFASNGEEGDVLRLTWQRTGGFMGLFEELVIYANRSVTYTSDQFGDGELLLTQAEVAALLDEGSLPAVDRIYPAKAGAADYFTYSVTVEFAGCETMVQWVDPWASAEGLPRKLLQLQSRIDGVIERIRQSVNDDVERAEQIAKSFLLKGPTFSFDGIPETLSVEGVAILESWPLQYRVTMTFESRHAGYGDRTGQVLAQVITPHTAVVTVVEDQVVSAVLDGRWDELRQEPVEYLTS